MISELKASCMEEKWDSVIENNTAYLNRSWTKHNIFTIECNNEMCPMNIKSKINFHSDEELLEYFNWIINGCINKKFTNSIDKIGFDNAWSLLGNDCLHGRSIESIQSNFMSMKRIPEPFSWINQNEAKVNEISLF